MLDQHLDEWVFLAGRPPLQEYLGFIAQQTTDEHAIDVGQLITGWRHANERVAQLQLNEAGAADNPVVTPLPDSLRGHATAAMASPVLARSFAAVPTEIGVVSLDSLVVFQKFINLRFVAELRSTLDADRSPEAMFRFCVPEEKHGPQVSVTRANQNTWVAISASTDLRFLGPAFLQPDQVLGYPATGYPTGVLAMGIGYGSNTLNVISVGNRLVLNNGSHRAYAMYEAGIREVPCVQHVQHREELTVIASGDLAAKGPSGNNLLGREEPLTG